MRRFLNPNTTVNAIILLINSNRDLFITTIIKKSRLMTG